ncbi:MAG: hypothetical protein MUE53_10105 [Chitinophagales bacterium]|jgi:hypothetical protein|nr:hypothetical protein [Chitinophagales bacterium]
MNLIYHKAIQDHLDICPEGGEGHVIMTTRGPRFFPKNPPKPNPILKLQDNLNRYKFELEWLKNRKFVVINSDAAIRIIQREIDIKTEQIRVAEISLNSLQEARDQGRDISNIDVDSFDSKVDMKFFEGL